MKWPVLLALMLTFLVVASPAHAQIIISEVQANPLEGSEWVELYNSSETPVPLEGWQLSDTLATPSVLLTIPTVTLQGFETKVFEVSGQKLNNTGDTVTVRDSLGAIVDSLPFLSATKAKSWQKTSIESTTIETEPTPGFQLVQPTPSPTPSPQVTPTPTPSLVPTPTPSPVPSLLPSSAPPNATSLDSLIIPQVYACPNAGEQEWIQLQNLSSEILPLVGVTLTDLAGNSLPLPNLLEPHSTTTITLSKSVLNNAGETLTFANKDGTPIKEVEILACQTGVSTTLTSYLQNTQTFQEIDSKVSEVSTNTATATQSASLENTPAMPPALLQLSQNMYALPLLKLPQPQTQMRDTPIELTRAAKQLPKSGVICAIVGGLLCCIAAAWYQYKQTLTAPS